MCLFSRGAVPAIPHRRLHHTTVLRDAALHCAQPDLGAEGAGQRLGAQPQPVLQAHALLSAHPEEQSELCTGVLLPAPEGPVRRRENQTRHPAPRLLQRRQRNGVRPAAHQRQRGVQQAAGCQKHQPPPFHLSDSEIEARDDGGRKKQIRRREEEEGMA